MSSPKSDNEYEKAIKKSLGILSYGDNSRRSLVTKLLQKGFQLDAANAAADEMIRLGYINEERQLARFIEREVNLNLLGPMKLIPKLIAKGYSREVIKKTLEELSDDGTISFELAREKITEGLSGDEAYRALYKKGHRN